MIHRGATNSGGKGSTWPPCRPRAFPSETRRCYIAMTYMTSWHGSHGPIAHMAMPAPCHCSIGTGRSSGDRGSDFPMTCASFGLPASRLESVAPGSRCGKSLHGFTTYGGIYRPSYFRIAFFCRDSVESPELCPGCAHLYQLWHNDLLRQRRD